MAIQIILTPKTNKRTLLLLLAVLLIFLAGFFPEFVENYYSKGFYPLFTFSLRKLLGWLPFSVADLFYGLAILWLVIQLFLSFRRHLSSLIGNILRFVCWIYILFKLSWGLNYNRLGVESQLAIQKKQYSKEELSQLTRELIDSANYYRKLFKDTVLPDQSVQQIFSSAAHSYSELSHSDSLNCKKLKLDYPASSVKSSFYTWLADYVGFTGYYAPFTGEAQVRTDMPRILLPYVTCHEIAHQLGYASESEASFIGYLAASNFKDPYFKYSVYLDLLSYAQRQEVLLYAQNGNFRELESVIDYNKSHIDTLVKKDKALIRNFFRQRQNNIAPVTASLYDQFLKLNQQMAGINSYDEVIAWLIAYRNKYGK